MANGKWQSSNDLVFAICHSLCGWRIRSDIYCRAARAAWDAVGYHEIWGGKYSAISCS